MARSTGQHHHQDVGLIPGLQVEKGLRCHQHRRAGHGVQPSLQPALKWFLPQTAPSGQTKPAPVPTHLLGSSDLFALYPVSFKLFT